MANEISSIFPSCTVMSSDSDVRMNGGQSGKRGGFRFCRREQSENNPAKKIPTETRKTKKGTEAPDAPRMQFPGIAVFAGRNFFAQLCDTNHQAFCLARPADGAPTVHAGTRVESRRASWSARKGSIITQKRRKHPKGARTEDSRTLRFIFPSQIPKDQAKQAMAIPSQIRLVISLMFGALCLLFFGIIGAIPDRGIEEVGPHLPSGVAIGLGPIGAGGSFPLPRGGV